jgi:hypothetical protein
VPPVEIPRLFLAVAGASVPQYVVAGACRIHPSTLSDYCAGKAPKLKHLRALAEYFDCEMEDLSGWMTINSEDYLDGEAGVN